MFFSPEFIEAMVRLDPDCLGERFTWRVRLFDKRDDGPTKAEIARIHLFGVAPSYNWKPPGTNGKTLRVDALCHVRSKCSKVTSNSTVELAKMQGATAEARLAWIGMPPPVFCKLCLHQASKQLAVLHARAMLA